MKCKLIVLMVMLLATVSFSVQACDQGKSSGVYVGGMAGVNLQIFDSNTTKTYPGGVVGGALGYKFQNGLRFEGEYSYRRNHLRRVNQYGSDRLKSGHTDTQACLANLLFDIDLCKGSTPYFGVGCGYARNSYTSTVLVVKQQAHVHSFAYQYIGGVMHRVMYNTDLGAEVKYFRSRKHAHDYTLALTMRRFF